MTKLIFLDIDGVMNRLGTVTQMRTRKRFRSYIGMEPELVERMNALVARTGAQVVLSSTWRLSETWRRDMKENGLTFEFVDRTPYLSNGFGIHLERGEEIDAWICQWLTEDLTRELDAYAIIDDDADMLPSQPLFRTSYIEGLTQEIADKVAEHLA